jgi:hypothetical protein
MYDAEKCASCVIMAAGVVTNLHMRTTHSKQTSRCATPGSTCWNLETILHVDIITGRA